ncbi:malonate decarboxylase holo-ACP synthase [Pandoraea sp. ISTKB]|uniref:malonate decarboxylase holo-ACP synthase n=1 Tax=Pandoraea sp. ISTKB TaxID=1586708 RepID=UPI0008466FF1|nr:malonate decarboxylase holo-ACP synthase [Pandoraea sp. ISTKB]ODP33231.1 phosphoribosyl-dephospho-CoA transferase [Pandoraea sp. ISTKB]
MTPAIATHRPSLRPHDLLWCDELVFPPEPSVPAWAHDAMTASVPVVVRRAPDAQPGLVPVGLRGTTRDQRIAAHASYRAVRRVVTPESLIDGVRDTCNTDVLPCLTALRELAPALNALGLHWGPTGGVGFALATGMPVLHAQSDLDLVVRLPFRPADSQVDTLAWIARDNVCRLDIQIDTGGGGFSLREWLGSPTRTLVKTQWGPKLVADPWDNPGDAP